MTEQTDREQALAVVRRTVEDADLIIVLGAGHVVEHGTHTQLLEQHGVYYDLWNAQVASDKEQAEEAQAEEDAGQTPRTPAP